ncbi:MAG: hypothetical protein ACQCXQ_00475 [Verrucomicrobiales bacterium]
MIIWAGMGILVPLITIVGIVIGVLLGSAVGCTEIGPGIGLVIGAFLNWLLWQKVYSKKPKVLIDPETGQQVLLAPKHSLFFIPVRAWTWIIAILSLPMIAGGLIAAKESARISRIPGFTGFEAANKRVASSGSGVTFGNSVKANQAAKLFSDTMKTSTKAMFTGGSEANLLTGGDFLTFCQDGGDTIVMLCHVPSLRSYNSAETRNALTNIAWAAAAEAVKPLDPEGEKSLMVGLRGIGSYQIILRRDAGAEAPEIDTDAADEAVFYPAFVTTGDAGRR